MKAPKLLLFIISAMIAATVSAFAGGFIATAAGFAGGAGFVLGGVLSLTGSALKLAAPGLFVGRAFVGFASFADLGRSGQMSGAPIFSQDRALYEYIVAHNKAAGFDEILPLKGYLRSEVVLGNQGSVDFALKDGELAPGQSLISPDENRLRLNDAFYATHYAVMFRTWDTTAAANRQKAKLQTFPNEIVFGATNAPLVSAAYNGRASLRVNDTVYIDSMDMLSFQRTSMAQQGHAISSVATTGVLENSEWEGDKAFREMTSPLVRLNGLYRNQFTVTFPDAYNFASVANTAVSAVLYLRGWLMQNGGSTRTKRGGV